MVHDAGHEAEQAKSPRRDPNAIAAVIAALIGLLALSVSGYTAWLQRQQVRAEVWPYLQPGISPSHKVMSLENKGVGPALIRSVKLYVDRKPQRNWPQAFDALGLRDMRDQSPSTINGVVLAPGDVIQQMVFKDPDRFARFYAQYPRIEMLICYCSALDECWLYDERADDRGQRRLPVAQCPAPDAEEFIDNRLLPGTGETAPGTDPAG